MRRFLLAAGLAAGIAGCGGNAVVLADRSDPRVSAEERRLAVLLASPGPILSRAGTCRVRLLRRHEAVSWAWAQCRAPAVGDVPEHAVSLPVRVDGTRIAVPGDGSAYTESVRQLFPPDLAEVVLDRDERVFP